MPPTTPVDFNLRPQPPLAKSFPGNKYTLPNENMAKCCTGNADSHIRGYTYSMNSILCSIAQTILGVSKPLLMENPTHEYV